MDFLIYVFLASGLHSTTYGWGESFCGDIGKPTACEKGAVTSSGEVFDPELPTAAIFAPTALYVPPTPIPLKLGEDGTCKYLNINDKGNPRFIGKRGFDVTPAAISLLGGEAQPTWSANLFICFDLMLEKKSAEEIIKWNLHTK